jgi:hypothetical protein
MAGPDYSKPGTTNVYRQGKVYVVTCGYDKDFGYLWCQITHKGQAIFNTGLHPAPEPAWREALDYLDNLG